jgi:hypothetical protein
VPQGSYTLETSCDLRQFQLARDFTLTVTGPRLPPPPGHSGGSWNAGPVAVSPPGIEFVDESFGASRTCPVVRMPVTVGGAGLTNVVAMARPAGTISGTVTIEPDQNGSRPQAPMLMPLIADPADARPSLGRLRPKFDRTAPSDQFTIKGLLPGAYFLHASLPTWVIKSILWNGHEYCDVPFDASARSDFANVAVTMVPASAAARLTGSVRDGHGGQAGNAAVILYPADPGQWTNYGLTPPQIRSPFVSSTATYDLSALPAGEYLVVAVPGSERLRWQEPGFFSRAAAQATRVTLKWGETANQDLTVVEVR